MLVKAVQQCLRYAGCRSLLQFDEVQENRNRFVRITNGCSQMNTVVSTESLLTVVNSAMRIDIFFSCFMMSSHSRRLIYAAMCTVTATQETSF